MNLIQFLIAKIRYPFMKRNLQNKMTPDVRSMLKDRGQMAEIGTRLRVKQQMGKMKHARKTGATLILMLLFISGYSQTPQKQIDQLNEKIYRFDKQSTLGASLFFAGAAGVGAGAFAVKGSENKRTTYIISGSVSLVGLLIHMTAYKQFRYDSRFQLSDGITYNF